MHEEAEIDSERNMEREERGRERRKGGKGRKNGRKERWREREYAPEYLEDLGVSL